jgi:hypothetical protein
MNPSQRHRRFLLGDLPHQKHQPMTSPPSLSQRVRTPNGDAQSMTCPTQSMSPAPDPNFSATHDPTSSFDGYASHSSPSSLSPERFLELTTLRAPGAMILERLDEQLESALHGPNGSTFVDDPPRRLLLSLQVLQVANSNAVKERFLFRSTISLLSRCHQASEVASLRRFKSKVLFVNVWPLSRANEVL